jgi:putative FmdB family regulatory protein
VPIYDYLCGVCGRVTEVIHGINDQGPRFCPNCGTEGAMRKALTAPAVVFKGSGWAKVDRRSSAGSSGSSGGSRSAAKPSSSPGESGGGSSATGTGSTSGSSSVGEAASGSTSGPGGDAEGGRGSGGTTSSSKGGGD